MEQKPLTVSALNRYIKNIFDSNPHLNQVYISGEVSNFKAHSSGHLYFALKDEFSRINAVMFSADAKKVKFRIEDGMKLIIKAQISVYEANGTYQLYVKDIKVDGLGELYLQFEQLKARLTIEGLFDQSHKKQIPLFPKKIAILTAPTGAAVQDVLITIKKRYPLVEITIIPTLVQGNQAAMSIVSSITAANQKGFDIIILGRGGGSLEDLWPFNEEIVARAIYDSKIPIISGVGHETDYTICDFVADIRATTPTAAAVIAVPDITELAYQVENYKQRIVSITTNKIELASVHLSSVNTSKIIVDPYSLIKSYLDKYTLLRNRLIHSNEVFLLNQYNSIDSYKNYLINILHTYVELYRVKQNQYSKQLLNINELLIVRQSSLLKELFLSLNLLNPENVLNRGYALVRDENKTLITNISDLKRINKVEIVMHDGSIYAVIEKETNYEEVK